MTDVTPSASDLMPSRRMAALAAVCAILLASCAVHDGTVSAAPTPTIVSDAPALTGVAVSPRELQPQRWVELRISGATADGWSVTSASLDSGYFSPVGPTVRTVNLYLGWAARVSVPLGDARCPAAKDPAVARLMVAAPDGSKTAVDVPLSADALAAINATECAARAATDVAMPTLGFPTRGEGVTVETTLELQRGVRNRDSAISVTQASGSVIFDLAPAAGQAFPLALSASEESAVMPVIFTAARCEPHAFAETKKTFVFAVWLSVDGGPESYVEIRPDEALKEALQRAFDACGVALNAATPGGP